MKAISITDVPTLIAAAGNRDFAHVLNNDDTEIIYLDYDGAHGNSIVSTISAVQNGGTAGHLYPVSVTLPAGTDMSRFVAGLVLSADGGNFPSGIIVESVNTSLRKLIFSSNTTEYTDGSAANVIDQTITCTFALTASNGMPLPPGATLVIDKAFHSIYNKAIYGIANTGKTVEVRTQGI